ncbi:hypothetical protein TWF192_009452 [Orbilia oligospora]|uniref:Uncharacterized protein n=1 Tax=Orbilia oligospora TaxID=2813651 RepID=A0A6G1M142_ORBOL|nr:hypothetical protein TWF191_002173 [Orbilia oligospora]KAF3240555.1 hypothetical protein TWF192_009452 [Orbilia oligospora]
MEKAKGVLAPAVVVTTTMYYYKRLVYLKPPTDQTLTINVPVVIVIAIAVTITTGLTTARGMQDSGRQRREVLALSRHGALDERPNSLVVLGFLDLLVHYELLS